MSLMGVLGPKGVRAMETQAQFTWCKPVGGASLLRAVFQSGFPGSWAPVCTAVTSGPELLPASASVSV